MRVESTQAIQDGLKPIPHRIRFYVDSYRAFLISEELARLSQAFTKTVIACSGGDGENLKQLVNWEITPAILADFIHGELRNVEDALLVAHEKSIEKKGCRVAYSRDIRKRANPYAIELTDKIGLKSASSIPDDSFVELISDGIIFAPSPLETSVAMRSLDALARKDPYSKDNWWHGQNRESIPEGKLFTKSGKELHFNRSQTFVDELASRPGSSSRNGRYNIQWKEYNLLNEKGVDTDLVVSAMDDLYTNDIDVFVFLTNDSDFVPLINRIKKQGKAVYICGVAKDRSSHLFHAVGGRNQCFDFTVDMNCEQRADMWLQSQDHASFTSLDNCLIQWRYYNSN